jgi:hypothetical protein
MLHSLVEVYKTFWRNIFPPALGLKMGAVSSSETMANFYQTI